ncbi:hypothetical protein THUN1379_03150 [Paludibacterium sp. THUN1379]|uniref:hypothetical protein n=1 Tax=Paludibacterium sp. THUN1379 TaxID=3112107 RepID=UPI003091755D|nr:hypothetical protein THUN1379_03150 [Paludibacterium sp. THUN1379]
MLPFQFYSLITSFRQFVRVVALCLVVVISLMFGMKAVFFGLFCIGMLHPVWLSMRMQDLVNAGQAISDPAIIKQLVYVQGIPVRENRSTLHNAFFTSPDTMQKELSRFSSTRFALYIAAFFWSLYDLGHALQSWNHQIGLPALAWVAALVMAIFFGKRAITYFAYWQIALRQTWHRTTIQVNGKTLHAAYTRYRDKTGVCYVPFLCGVFTPEVAIHDTRPD